MVLTILNKKISPRSYLKGAMIYLKKVICLICLFVFFVAATTTTAAAT